MTDVPVVAKVATSAVTEVPNGTVTAIVRAPSSIVPTTAGESPWKLKAVILTAGLRATVTVTTYARVELPTATTV